MPPKISKELQLKFEKFLEEENRLEEIIGFVTQEFTPDEIYSSTDVAVAAATILDPEDVFSKDKLTTWAEDSGFIHESELPSE